MYSGLYHRVWTHVDLSLNPLLTFQGNDTLVVFVGSWEADFEMQRFIRECFGGQLLRKRKEESRIRQRGIRDYSEVS